MPNLINQTFFVRDLTIPNLNQSSEQEKLSSFIVKYESECLKSILGYPLYRLIDSESSQRMTDLLDGAEYTDGEGSIKKWDGLVHDTDISLIANYTYFKIQEFNATKSTGVGTSVSKTVAGFASSPAGLMTIAWNFFSEEVLRMSHFLWMKKDGSNARVYSEFTFHQYCETRRFSSRIDSIFSF